MSDGVLSNSPLKIRIYVLQFEKAATAENRAASKRAPSASRQYMSCKKFQRAVINSLDEW